MECSQVIYVGDMENGRIISVDLSNGVSLRFNRNNINDVESILGIFPPGDIRIILDAVVKDNKNLENENYN